VKVNLIGLSKDELFAVVDEMGEKPFRAKQLWQWIYNKGETDFAKMTSLAKDFRERLAAKYEIARPKVIRELTSDDRTRKWLMGFADGGAVESVYIPEEDRGAVCISTQIGCAMKCAFCNTGSQGFTRNLSAGEIVGQFMLARDSYGEWPTPADETRYLSNIVVMGMGEPLNNFDNTVKALKILMDDEGICISRRRITVSTSGIVPMIPKVATDMRVRLAVSLHAPNDEIRNKIMPINKKYPVAELMAACREYRKIANEPRQRITFEYIMIDGLNDSEECAHELIRLVKGVGAKFNLIPFNEWAGCPFKTSPMPRVERFQKILLKAGYTAPIRASRGRDIMAACGQLKSKSAT
jgi:23S rRNA m2A2503 methyltransferase